MNQDTRQEIEQVRMNELAGKHVHLALLKGPRFWTRTVEVLTIIVPIIYFAPKELLQNTSWKGFVTGLEISLGIALLGLSVLRNILRWDDRVLAHRIHMANDIRAANRAEEILCDPGSREDIGRLFLKFAKEPVQDEMALLEDVPAKIKQAAYREALKEFRPGSVGHAVCMNCKKSVWDFKSGDCQLCGGGRA